MTLNSNSQIMKMLTDELRDADSISRAVASHGHGVVRGRTRSGLLPVTPTEQVLARIWADEMKLEYVCADEGFLDLGGHSLSAIQIASQVRSIFDVEIPLSAWFDNPTVVSLAKQIDHVRQTDERAARNDER